MPLGIPEAMREEHEELHRELLKATNLPGHVGEAAKRVAQILHPHFEKENELALPVIGVARELAEGKTPADYEKALDLHDRFKNEYAKMLQEHVDILEALDGLEKNASDRARYRPDKEYDVTEFTRKLRLHTKTEEDLTYPAILMVGKLLKQV